MGCHRRVVVIGVVRTDIITRGVLAEQAPKLFDEPSASRFTPRNSGSPTAGSRRLT
jgi:hypothetical protein